MLAAGMLSLPLAVTRWSTIQLIPNADMLPGGRFTAEVDFLWGLDDFSFSSPVFGQHLRFGFSEWVGLDIGYVDGFTMGMKARVIKEDLNRWYVPSLAIGAQNLYTSREAFYFDGGNDYPKNEFYAVAAKSSEWAMLRGHAGFMSAVTGEGGKDRFNPFIGIEKYFGQGFYVTAEAQRRTADFLLSLFVVYRPLSDRFEFNVGVIDAPGVGGRDDPKAFKPMFRAGLKVLLGAGFNSLDGLTGVEDRIDRQRELISALNRRIDAMAVETQWNADRIHELSGLSIDSRNEERKRVVDELTRLRNLYDQEPFDPEVVRNMIEDIRARYDDFYSPHLRVIITDSELDSRIRRLAVSIIGDMRDKAASNILISILGRFEEPTLKIETMVALGKMKEERAGPMLLQLKNDQNRGVAFAAREAHNLIFGSETGEETGPLMDDNIIPERRLGR
jgi:hypothetical protein